MTTALDLISDLVEESATAALAFSDASVAGKTQLAILAAEELVAIKRRVELVFSMASNARTQEMRAERAE